ncbi:MAG: multifunctional oxoglutarate decarboxylase/oxoglutarate dehydrogenase thiamine pyrophosphate-binding subunit/dihydrolipoyllysine-residue succinyltransferase subunit [Actinobacteria bacterium]|uniref:oxoglutarate dehydrogenase (succinyl-transferring) n=1 Tax=freshwater metagenome TaxID=449393 RepID=A0A6J7CND0_9ZZZZ|nr:multifunctional oxoglutarate decarboxylase/oxoglutarate dehydrogenase thiamine pyrophosphate-binding subunit/dihydrolipoyllysine-residue succinyltransferase subunit [Actinomycetota bacterium]
MATEPTDGRMAGFGANEGLVDEIYEQYLKDRTSVDPAWWEFFDGYAPADHSPAAAAHAEAVAQQASPTTSTPPAPPIAAPATPAQPSGDVTVLKGAAARVVTNMEASLAVPTATSVRALPAKLLIDNRVVINNHLARSRGGKVSFTHLIGYAVVRAAADIPAMNASLISVGGKPAISLNPDVNLGLAIDLAKPDGSRQLLVPNIKGAQAMDFALFWATYDDLVRKARSGKLTVADFAGTTISLTNPGTIGTNHSVPRLMDGQGCIVGVGSMDYPAEWEGASSEAIARNAVSKILTLTSTYDHRIIQGAQSGEFLRRIHELLLGGDDFYGEIFRSLRIPYEPIRWARDISSSHETDLDKTVRVQEIIHAYRVRGHLMADTDPLEYHQRMHPDLDVLQHSLTLWDLDREFATGGFGGRPLMKLREILGVLRDSYTRTVGVEYMHIQDPDQRRWIQDRVELPHAKPAREEQLRILHKLNEAEALESFLQTKYVGQKRFSLEGGESLIPLLDAILAAAAHDDILEVAIGMPHRGRLNVLTNIAGKSYAQVFREFEGHYGEESVQGSGDVKYHLGTTGVFTAPDGATTAVYLAANPSHLEAVNPVLEGVVRAKQDLLPRDRPFDILPVLMHGDAAFAGQGVVAETLQMSQIQGYRTGGTVHIVVNNQVGFTTSPKYSRSSVYCTDVARAVQAPIFHVNGDDPEAVVRVAQLAFEFRQAFAKDVVIDLVCFRKRGHNEADDPSLTQPLMYSIIDAKRSVRKHYTEALIGRGDITVEEAEGALKHFQEQLERIFQETRSETDDSHFSPASQDIITTGQRELTLQGPAGEVDTAISLEQIDTVISSQLTMPEDFTIHPRLAPQLQRRAQMVADDAIDWGMGEALAVGSLLLDGKVVRLAGQDSRRGTFGHRHMVIVDKETGWQYKPLKQCYRGDAKLYVYDSLLSEYAAMGFEYGYSVARPDALVMWEAQFGDFADGAQTIIDEFISSGEQKWGQRSAVTLLLPHGYEGQGPDHSSARIERFLQLCAQDNMTVAMPSSPASFFHLLRWQVLGPLTRPLVIFTPKSLLRAKFAVSKKQDFTTGHFQPMLPDPVVDPATVKTVLLCSGKVYYDLLAHRDANNRHDVAVIRIERLYPLPYRTLPVELEKMPDAEIRWVQEEPANQGPWSFIAMNLPEVIARPITGISRPASSSPAVGAHHRHDAEQQAIIDQAFAVRD